MKPIDKNIVMRWMFFLLESSSNTNEILLFYAYY